MAKGDVFQEGRARSRVTRCESSGCLAMTTVGGEVFPQFGDEPILVTETDDPGPYFFTDKRSIESFAERGPVNYLKEPGEGDTIIMHDFVDGKVLLGDIRDYRNLIATTPENIEAWRLDLSCALGELASAGAVNV